MNIFEELGIQRYSNAQDTFTKYGASCMWPESLRAMQEIAGSFVDLAQVQEKAGDAIARLTHNEAAYISNGAAGGLMLCAAVCLAVDSEAIYQALPETGIRSEILVQRAQRNPYEKSLETAGARLVFLGEESKPPDEAKLASAISEKTAAVAYFIYHGRDGSLPLESVLEIAHERNVPVIVDAAAQNPPVANLWRFTDMGADMVVFSGGKALRGPQDSGLILGRQEWIKRCRRWGPPAEGVCRCCKTSREAIAGLYAAVKACLAQDEAAERLRLLDACAHFEKALYRCGFTRVWQSEEGPVGQAFPRVFGKLPFGDAAQLFQDMKQEGIYVGVEEAENTVVLNPLMLTSQQVRQVCSVLEQCMLRLK